MKQLYISQLNEHLGEALTEEFYLKDIFMKYTKDKGIPYLHLMLQDKTGSLAGRVWENIWGSPPEQQEVSGIYRMEDGTSY